MAADLLKYAIGNSASTTTSSAVGDTDTSVPLTSDTNFSAKTGEGMVVIDEGEATEEFAYATGKTGSSLTTPLVNRGLEGGSAQGHDSGATVKGIFTAGMWNNLIDSISNVLVKTSGALDTTKVVNLATAQQLSNKTHNGDFGLVGATDNIIVNSVDPNRTITLLPGALQPATTSGCSSSTKVEAGTNDIDYQVLDFDTTSDETAFINFAMPDSWDAGVVQFRVYWTNAGGGAAETVSWALEGRSLANDDAIDQANGTAVVVADTWIAQGDVHITAWSGDVTLAGTPAAGELVHLEIFRDVSADDLTGDARLIALQIRYKQATYSD